MAFTEQNKSDAYLFFALAFNAAPGKQFGAQIVEAYEAGMTTAEIVAQYITKPDFLKLYPATQTAAEFAAALVGNVAAASTSAAAKTAAIADIQKALAAGMTKDQVIVQILGNLSTKPVTDLDWGTTVAQLNNKIAVAKVLTEGDKALDTTDAALLQGPLKGVTSDAATVAKAIAAAGNLSEKLDNLLAKNKAVAEFAAALDLDGNGLADNLTPVNVQAAVDTDVANKATAVTALATGWGSTLTPAVNNAALSAAKLTNDAAVATAQANVLTAQAAAKTAGATDAQTAQLAALTANVKSAVDTAAVAVANQGLVHAQLKASLSEADATALPAVASTGVVTNYIAVNATTGKLELDSSATTKVTEANKAAVSALIKAAQAVLDTASAQSNATTAKTTFEGTLAAGVVTAIADIETAKTALVAAQAKTPTLDKALAAYNAANANKTKLADVNKGVADAKLAFTDAGLTEPAVADTALVATEKADVYYTVGGIGSIASFGLLGADSIYVGKNYVLNATGDLAKGDAATLEVFFKANGTSTDVYVEQKAFGSSDAAAATGNANIAKVTLSGVAADKLTIKDGFIVLA